MKLADNIQAAAWPLERLGECLQALLAQAGVAAPAGIPQFWPNSPADPDDVATSIARLAGQLGCDTVALSASRRDLRTQLTTAFPALLALSPNAYLAITSSRRGGLVCLCASGALIAIEVGTAYRPTGYRP